MTRAQRGAVAVAGAILIAAFPTVAQQKAPTEQELKAKGARQMTGAEAKASRVGNTWHYLRPADGAAVLAVFYPDERTKRAVLRGNRRASFWWLEGDRICEDSFVVTGHLCFRVWVLNSVAHVCVEGQSTCESIVRQTPGNPEKL